MQVSVSLGCLLSRYPKRHLNILYLPDYTFGVIYHFFAHIKHTISFLNFFMVSLFCRFPASTLHAIGLDHSLQSYFNSL